MSDTLSHIAAPYVNVCGRIVQRCAFCGAKLCDSLNTAAPANADGSAPEFPTWPAFRLVRVSVGNPTLYEVLPETDKIPDDLCSEFV